MQSHMIKSIGILKRYVNNFLELVEILLKAKGEIM